MNKGGFHDIEKIEFNERYPTGVINELPKKEKPMTKKQRTRKEMLDARQDAIYAKLDKANWDYLS